MVWFGGGVGFWLGNADGAGVGVGALVWLPHSPQASGHLLETKAVLHRNCGLGTRSHVEGSGSHSVGAAVVGCNDWALVGANVGR